MTEKIPQEAEVLGKLIGWAERQEAVRALILTSSRARPGGPVDLLSDYDVVIATTDADRLGREDAWLTHYGRPLVRWGDEGELYGLKTCFRSVIYDDCVKIDYTVWPVELLGRVSATAALPECLDEGYRVLLDKDGSTISWLPPTHQAYIPARPTEEQYRALVEEFWWVASYVAKSLWRDELVFAKFCLEHEVKVDVLRRMLEWWIEIGHGWSIRPGVLGRGLKLLLPADIWSEMEASYVGPRIEENWDALFRSTALFRRVAVDVADALGYAYPEALDHRMNTYLNMIRTLPRESP